MTRYLHTATWLIAATLVLSACSTSKEELKTGMDSSQDTAKAVATSDEANMAKASAAGDPVVGAIEGVEIAGYCPVAYVAANKPVKGVAEHAVVQDGVTYWFVNADAKAAYEATPEKFEVKYKGWCATGLSMGKKIPSDPAVFAVHAGKVYLFSNTDARDAFLQSPDTMVSAADTQWSSM
jgi:YHS domain-containing protein